MASRFVKSDGTGTGGKVPVGGSGRSTGYKSTSASTATKSQPGSQPRGGRETVLSGSHHSVQTTASACLKYDDAAAAYASNFPGQEDWGPGSKVNTKPVDMCKPEPLAGVRRGPRPRTNIDDSVSACMNFDLPDKNAPKPTTSRVRDAVVPCWVLDWREDDFEGRDKREKAIPKPKCTAEQRRDMMNKIKSMTNDVHKTRAERVALESKLMELKKAMVEAPP